MRQSFKEIVLKILQNKNLFSELKACVLKNSFD